MLKKIFESTLIIGSSYIFVMALDMVRVKIFAVLLGPQGIGTLSILNQFHVVATTITSLGLGTGIVKYVATFESECNQLLVQRLVKNAFQIVLIAALSAFVLCFLFSSHVSHWILGDQSNSIFILIYSVSFPLAIYPMVAMNFLVGLKKIRSLAKINIYRSIISLLFIIPIVYYYRLKGAVFAVLVITSVHLILTYYYLAKEKRLLKIFKLQAFDSSLLKKLFPYGIASLLTGTTYYLSHLVLKMIIVHHLGMEMNGIYQPIWALTMTYPALILSSMSAYSYPRICELNNDNKIVDELNGIFRVTTLLIVPVMFFLLVARKPIIQILYSSNFLEATKFMPLQIIGDFFRVLVWSIGMFFLPTKRIQAFIWLGILPDGLLVLFAATLVVPYKLYGIALGFTLCYLLTFLIYYWYSQKSIGFRFWRENLKLFLASFGALVTINLICWHFDNVISLGINILVIFIWGLLSIRKKEVLGLKSYLKEKIIHKTALTSS